MVCGWCGGADGTEEAGSCPGMATASASCGSPEPKRGEKRKHSKEEKAAKKAKKQT